VRTATVDKANEALVVAIPAESSRALGLQRGDTLHLIEDPAAGILLSKNDAKYIEAMRVARRVMDE
jgi:bifunctional DNA-binding transcriptional regulator/antitoxin component of YhaV-PrlF toxin-antitoxin module